MFKGAYTLSKALNETDNDGRAVLDFNTPSELWRNWGPAGFDRRHNFQLGFAYALPWHSDGGGYGSVAGALAKDWQINGTYAAFSGNPFTMLAAGTSLNTPGNNPGNNTAGANTADQVGDYTITGNIGNEGPWFNTAGFGQPTGVRFGDTGRNQFYGPGGQSLDLSVFRAFPVGGTKRLEARIEMGNLFNIPVFANPTNNLTSATFGQITGIAGGTALTNAAYIERQIRLGLRFSF
jgi:hypothetical protein